MKRKSILSILALVALFATATVSAQVNRSIGNQQYKNPKPKKVKQDIVEQSVQYFTMELKLDDFQQAAAREIIEAERVTMTELNEAHDITINERKDRAAAISDRIYKKMVPLLSKEQAEKYTKMQEARKF